jgi:H+/Cl- antiporter ClcA
MIAATALTGVAAGLGGSAVTLLLHLVQHLAFGYTEDTFLLGVEQASSARRVLALTAGGAMVGTGWCLHRRHFDAQELSVSRALRDANSRLPVLATTSDAILQIIAVGAGASLGREGAPRQIGAALGGWLSARLQVNSAQRRTLLACGAGAGLAAVYNVPFGGAAFTLEILLGSLLLADVVAALCTAVIATAVAWPFLSDHPTYQVSGVHLHAPLLAWSLLLGPMAGVGGVAFVRLMSTARGHAPSGWRSVCSIVLVFAALGAFAIAYPQLLGNGKGPAQLAFAGTASLGLAGALALLKPLATAACLGSGAIGGLLTPALATGAMFGVFAGRLWDLIWPGASPVEYAILGACALLAVTQRAPLTAIVLVLEFIHTGQQLLLPMVLAVGLALTTAGLLDRSMVSWPVRAAHLAGAPSPSGLRS